MLVLTSFDLGLLSSVCGSLTGTLGGQLRIAALSHSGRLALCLQACGWATWLFGQCCQQVAILFAPATVAACIMFSGSLLSNALLAPLVLGEHLTLQHGIGIALLSVGGSAVTWASSQHSHDAQSWGELSGLVDELDSRIALSGTFCVAFVLLVQAAKARSMHVVAFAYLFALCGACDLLVTKFTLQLCRLKVEAPVGLKNDLPSKSQVGCFVAAMFAMHIGTFLFQVASVYYRKALESLPLFLGSGAVMQICLCGIFFREFDFNLLEATVFGLGFALVLAGLVVTSHAPPCEGGDEDEDGLHASSRNFVIDEEAGRGTERGADSPIKHEAVITTPSRDSLGSTLTPEHKKVCNDFGVPFVRSEPFNMGRQFVLPPLDTACLDHNQNHKHHHPHSPCPIRQHSLSSVDLIFVPELQRGAFLFKGRSAQALQREPSIWLRRPFIQRSRSSPSSPHMTGGGTGRTHFSSSSDLATTKRAQSLQEELLPNASLV